MAIRGKPAEVVRTRLRAFCLQAGHTTPAWYVFLANGTAIPLRALTSRRGRAELRKSLPRGAPAVIRVGIAGAKIRIKNNARIVYRASQPEKTQLTAKVALPSQVTSGSLAREIKARRLLLRAAETLPIPKLTNYDRKHLRWLIEEFVGPTEQLTAADKIDLFFRRHAKELYAPLVRSRPISNWLRRCNISWRQLAQVLEEAGVTFDERLHDAAWPVALLHGDLSAGNMMAGCDGRLYLVDWEKFHAGPVAWDFKKLSLRERVSVEKLLREIGGSRDTDPTTQIRVVLALDLISRRRDRAVWHAYQTSHLGKSEEEAARSLNAREHELLRAIAGQPKFEIDASAGDSVESPALDSAGLVESLRALDAYSRLPPRFERMHPHLVSAAKEDKFGAALRLSAVQEVLHGRNLGHMIDLGGNAGYFSLSLVDSGMATGSIVYDRNARALRAGRIMARELGLQDKVTFVEHDIDLDFVRSLGHADTTLCLNIMHHAGALFDVDTVAQAGWEAYACHWLRELRTKTRLAILGLGFKNAKPRNWNIAAAGRARRFYELARGTGWKVLYDANVEDLRVLGTREAGGLRTRLSIKEKFLRLFRSSEPENDQAPADDPLKSKYHLYILQSGRSSR